MAFDNILEFRNKLLKEIAFLSKEEFVKFSWRCAIRALPFLGTNDNFNFWNKNKQQVLYKIFNALDLISLDKVQLDNFYSSQHYATFSFPHELVDITVSTASKIAYDAYHTKEYLYTVKSYGAAYGAYKTARSASYNYKFNYQEILGEKILDDIKRIKQKNKPTISIKEYEIVWIKFQRALKNEGCDYWADWYGKLFENNFEFDPEEVEKRINLPQEIIAQGAAAVGAEMERILSEGSERLNEARIIILGEKGVGKTCIARKLIDLKAPMTKAGESTPGVDTTLWKLQTETDPINVRIWDFAGHTVTHAAHQFFLSERSLYILVYDGRSEERNRLRYWLDHVKNYGGTNSKAIILVNEQDVHTVDIPINTLKEEYPIEGIYTFNMKSDMKKLQSFREVVSDYIIHNPSWEKQHISKSYYQVKNELEKLFTNNIRKDKEFIQKEQFLAIANKYGIDDADTLLKSLHALGVSLWYPELGEYNMLILNPEWISDGVYKIINWVNTQDTHTILLSGFSEIFAKEARRFPKEKHEFLFDLMIKYELAYTLRGTRLVIPHLLKEDQPETLPIFSEKSALLLKYEANQPLPPNTISRFIVRHNKEIKILNKKQMVWRFGVFLGDKDGTTALIKENQRERTISVSVQGKNKTTYISKLRETLNDIFKTYRSLEPELSYKVIDSNLPAKHERFIEEQSIVSHLKHNRAFYDPIANLDILLDKVAKDYNINLNITINHQPNIITDNQTVVTGGSVGDITNTNFNFQDCTIDLKANIDELVSKLSKKGYSEDVEELQEISELLEEVEGKEDKEEIKKELRKKNFPRRFGRVFKDLGDKDSTLYKTVEGGKRVIGIAQDIAEEYNKLAQWLAWPQVPKPFLKKAKK